tara:strand:+ start:664 stop:1173 length:510 start_codon:yes stop_codon:yes gene_type:complete
MSKEYPTEIPFAPRTSVEQVEEGNQLAPKFDENGCIPCITTHAETREVLMFAFMNSDALRLSISTGLAHYWSRSREKLWKKGETSGMFQHIDRIRIDDDQDCVILEVKLTPPATGGIEASCHVGYRSCFYRAVPVKPETAEDLRLEFLEDDKSFDPDLVYPGVPNPTRL